MTTVADKKSKEVSYKPLAYVLALSMVGLILLFVMGGAAPLYFVFLLSAIIPMTAYLFLRAKWLVLITPALFGIVLILNYNIIFVLSIPLLVFGTYACIAAAKSEKLFFGAALVITAVLGGLAFPIWMATTISGKNAGETVAEYILTQKEDAAIVNRAKNFVYEVEVADALAFNPMKTADEVKREAALAVNAMSIDEILLRYSSHICDKVNFELLFFVFSIGAMIAMTAFLILTLLLLSYQHLLKSASPPPLFNKTIYRMTPPRHMIMPQRYVLCLLVPYILLFILRPYVPFMKMIFDATYFGVILVPFGFAGIGLTYYLLKCLNVNLGYSSILILLVILLTFMGFEIIFMLFSCVGMVDYFLNLRFIIEHYKKQNKENKNESNT